MKELAIIVIMCLYFIGMAGYTAQAEEPIFIAGLYPAVKTTQFTVAFQLRSISVALDEINASGGLLGHPVELLEFQPTTPIEAAEMAERALEQGALAMIGSSYSTVSLAMAPIFQEAGIPMIAPSSTNEKVTLVGDYIFRACFIDPFQGKLMAQFAREDLNAKTAVILIKADSAYSLGLAEVFAQAFREQGEILWEDRYLANDADFSRQLQKIKDLQPDVVFVPGHVRDCAFILKQAELMDVQATFIGGDGWNNDLLDLAGTDAMEGHYYSSHWHNKVTRPLSLDYVERYRQKFDEETASGSSALAYDATLLWANAVRRAQSLDPKAVRDALAATKGFEGTTGTITFDENRNPINKDAVILTFRDGSLEFAKSIRP